MERESYRSWKGRRGFELALTRAAVPEPKGREALLRVLACGVCGTDVHILRNFEEYTPLGHEISAVVEKTGPDVTAVRPGERVVSEDVTYCGRCAMCKNGRTDLCRNMRSLNGQAGMGEYLLVDESMLVSAEGVDPVAASLTEPLAVALNTYFAAHLPPEGNLAVFGIGVLGILCAALARHYGAGRVICIGSRPGSARNAKREEAALAVGADAVLYSADPDYPQKAAELARGRVDAVIVTSPPATLPGALAIAGYGAPVVAIGVDMGAHAAVELDIDRLIFNKNAVIPVLAEPARMFPLSMRLLRSGVIDAGRLITHRFPLEAAGQSLRELFENDRPVIKAVLVNDGARGAE